jgi:hypothetical protein
MKTVGKIIVALLLLVAIGLAVSVYLLLNNLDGLVEDGIETYGSEMLQSNVSVGGVKISLTDGQGEITGLAINNPDGFSNAKAFAIDKAAINLDIDSLKGLLDQSSSSALVVVDSIDISGARLLLEQQGVNKNNLQTLLDNVKRYSSSGASADQAGADSAAGQEIKLNIKQFNFTEADVTLSSDIAGSKQLALPAIRLKDIGSGDGASIEEVVRQVIEPILAAAVKQGQQGVIDEALDKALDNEKLKGVKGLLKGFGGSSDSK